VPAEVSARPAGGRIGTQAFETLHHDGLHENGMPAGILHFGVALPPEICFNS